MSAIDRRTFLAGSAAAAASIAMPGLARAQANPGVTATELKIGTTTSLSGPVSALGTINKAQAAYFKMLNEQGGVGGRKINYIILDDGFNPAKTLEQTRRLVEEEEAIDAGVRGNAARWINHACTPNCEADEIDGRVFVSAITDIAPGEELFYDYGLVIDDRYTKKLKKQFECRCGTAGCRGTMLAPKR